MLHTLESEFIKIAADTKGGELHSVVGKKTGTEFLWTGDPAYWPYHAPVLFPIVGRVKDDWMPRHGFARTSEFELAENFGDTLAFRLAHAADEAYPFDCALTIRHTLEFNEVLTEYLVENTGESEMFFSIGGHPGFRCPLKDGESFSDYYLEFNRKEDAEKLVLTPEGFMTRERETFLDNENRVPLSYDLFAVDAVVLENLKSETVSLKSKNHKSHITFSFEGFPLLGIWSKKDAPFLCIEPWFGHSDYVDFTGSLKEKDGILSLAQGKTFSCEYTVTVADV